MSARATQAADNYLVGYFVEDEDILAATKATRQAGLPIYDCYTPFPVHGLEAAQGLPRSWMTYACFLLALTGFLTSLFMQSYTQAIETPLWSGWPLNVGGKPFLPLTSFVPVLFELAVLFAGVGTALTLLAFLGLYPGQKPKFTLPGTTDDRFALVLDTAAAGFDESKARELMQRHGASEISWVAPNR
ncbi:MAG: DUF3341 domain-containing protein [Deltaproteobacteria bacterium]|nr:DUF3341 domain-containing protein [Deltaproteobacteria bacterium]